MRAVYFGLIAALLPAIAYAAPGRCLLRVEGETLLSGTCNVLTYPDGGFSIGMVETDAEKPSPYFASVNPDEGKMKGFWNGQRGATHAHTPVGTLRKNGACWENATASICAWKS